MVASDCEVLVSEILEANKATIEWQHLPFNRLNSDVRDPKSEIRVPKSDVRRPNLLLPNLQFAIRNSQLIDTSRPSLLQSDNFGYARDRMIWNFGDVSEEMGRAEAARFGVVPVPLERTTSYGKGTGAGPEAIVAASRYLELFDEVYRFQPADAGIWTAKPLSLNHETLDAAIHHIYTNAAELIRTEKFLVFLGGEHSITYPIVRAYRERFPRLSVLQVDAHADLRTEYEGTEYSHACVMRRVVALCRSVQVGIRSLSREEFDALPGLDTTMIFAHEFLGDPGGAVQKVLANLGPDVYITFDLDGFDPSLLPATGTPEPGGLFWGDALNLLERVFASRRVVGCDIVELAPLAGYHAGDFLAAKLAYKMMAMKQFFAASDLNSTLGG